MAMSITSHPDNGDRPDPSDLVADRGGHATPPPLMSATHSGVVASSEDTIIPGSHRTVTNDGKVTIYDVELFVGYDPDIDDPDDDRMAKYDETGIARVALATQRYMAKGQNPKLILGHNPDDGGGDVRPAIGDIVRVASGVIGGLPGLYGDI